MKRMKAFIYSKMIPKVVILLTMLSIFEEYKGKYIKIIQKSNSDYYNCIFIHLHTKIQ